MKKAQNQRERFSVALVRNLGIFCLLSGLLGFFAVIPTLGEPIPEWVPKWITSNLLILHLITWFGLATGVLFFKIADKMANKSSMPRDIKPTPHQRGKSPTFYVFLSMSQGMAGKAMVSYTKSGVAEEIREKFEQPNADVIIFDPNEWNPPPLALTSEAIRAAYPQVQKAINEKLLSAGIPKDVLLTISKEIHVNANPVTGVAIFTVAIA